MSVKSSPIEPEDVGSARLTSAAADDAEHRPAPGVRGATPKRDARSVEAPTAPEAGDASKLAPTPQGQSQSGGLALRLFVIGLAVGLAALFAINWNKWVGAAIDQSTDNAYLQSDLTPLAAKVSGYVRNVPVGDFQMVKAGELLVQIDDDEYQAQASQAEANVEAAQADLDNAESQKSVQQTLIAQATASIAATEAELNRDHLESVRQRDLLERSAGARQKVEVADANEARMQATLALNRAQLDQQRQQIKVLDTREQTARATLKARLSALTLARINLGYTKINAPVDGMVGQRQVRPGQYVSVGTQVISVVPLSNIWVVANYKETQMTRIRVGQPASVTIDAFPGVVLKGHVDGWSPATGAQFSLLPPDNATGNFTKVVQRVPVKIALEPDKTLGDLLRPGMSVIATIDTRDSKTSAPVTAGR